MSYPWVQNMYKPRQRTKVDKGNVDAGEDKVFDGQWNQFY